MFSTNNHNVQLNNNNHNHNHNHNHNYDHDRDESDDGDEGVQLDTPASEAESSSNVNLFRMATPDEITAHEHAELTFLSLMSQDPTVTSVELQSHFKRVTTMKQLSMRNAKINRLRNVLVLLSEQIRLQPKRRIKKFKKTYNTALNNFVGILTEDSLFQCLLPINDHLKHLSKRIPTVRARPDFASGFGETIGETLEPDGFILHVHGSTRGKAGGRTAVNPKSCLSAMRASIEQCVTWSDLEELPIQAPYGRQTPSNEMGVVKLQLNQVQNRACSLVLNIRIVGTDFVERSDSSRLRHILCGGNPPKKGRGSGRGGGSIDDSHPDFPRLYPDYAEFLRLVKQQVFQIIRNSHANPACRYTFVSCCRAVPVCHGSTLGIKHSTGMSKRITCGECRMDLCLAGCGRVYHGESSCEQSLDEASQALINGSTKPCPNPGCRAPIDKNEGCNHMTCSQCRTEFCWICGLELPRDARGHYSTAMHFNPGQFGVGVQGGCRQFN